MEGSIPFGEDSRGDLVKLKDSQNCIGQHSTVAMPHIQKRTLSNSTFTNVQKKLHIWFCSTAKPNGAKLQSYKPISYFHSNDYWSFSKGTSRGKKAKGERKSKWDLNDTA